MLLTKPFHWECCEYVYKANDGDEDDNDDTGGTSNNTKNNNDGMDLWQIKEKRKKKKLKKLLEKDGEKKMFENEKLFRAHYKINRLISSVCRSVTSFSALTFSSGSQSKYSYKIDVHGYPCLWPSQCSANELQTIIFDFGIS